MNERFSNGSSSLKFATTKPRPMRRSKTSLNLKLKLGLKVDIASANGKEDIDPSKPLVIPHTDNLYLRKQNPLLRRHSFYTKGKLYNDEFSIQEDGLTIKTTPSSCSLISNASYSSLTSETLPLSPPQVMQEETWHEMKISKHQIKKGKRIGGGASSSVYLGKMRSTGQKIALKVVNKATYCHTTAQIFNEMKGLSNLTTNGYFAHPCIVTFYGAYLDEKSVVVCLEYMNAGSLKDAFQTLGRIPEKPLGGMMYQVCQGLNFVHNMKRTMHRDIKPANILINRKGEVKLADFGVSRDFLDAQKDRCSLTFIGTFHYMSPERITGKKYSFPADMWALGVTLFTAATGDFPFNLSRFELIGEVCDLDFKTQFPEDTPTLKFSIPMRNFLQQLLIKNADDRLKAEHAGNHEWFTMLDINGLDDAIEIVRSFQVVGSQ